MAGVGKKMTTRIGITTDPETQRLYLERVFQSLSHWRIEAGPLTKAAAQQRKRYLVAWRGCETHRDETEVANTNWYVYSFKYDVHK
jgi:hypothetical protein